MLLFKVLAIVAFLATSIESAKRITSRPIQLGNLESHIANLDRNEGFKAEFSSLGEPQTQLRSWDYASLPPNLVKHRYPPPEDQLLTYDETRVVLHKIPGDEHSDFINANWIDNYAREPTYIATQCPIDSTIDDFYRMVWEKNVHEVVALANPHDIEKKKCAKYFPEDSAKYGGLDIFLERKEEFPDVHVRIYSLKKNETIRVFVHHHFVSWPDLGVPNDPKQLLDLILRYRTSDTYTKAWPLLVHCSAGVGRTGTFLLTDAMFEMAKETGTVDFLTHLTHIRNQRISVVEKPEQYRLAHLVILEAHKRGLFDKTKGVSAWKAALIDTTNTDWNNNNMNTNTNVNNRNTNTWSGQGQQNRQQEWNKENTDRTGHFITNNKGTTNTWSTVNNQKKSSTISANIDNTNEDEIVIRISKEPRIAVPCAA